MQPITSGTINGAINATIQAGLAYPAFYENRTVEVPEIILYGTTLDKVPYLIQLSGVGKLTGQMTRLVCLAARSSKLQLAAGFELVYFDADVGYGSSKLKLVEVTRP